MGHINVKGSSVAIVFRQLERELLQHLEVAKAEKEAGSHVVNKRRRLHSPDRPDNVSVDDEGNDEDGNDDRNGLFIIDLTGDERLAISRDQRF